MATPEEIVSTLFFGDPVKLGQRCPECPEEHWCDAICFRFKPKVYLCLGCGQNQKHGNMKILVSRYRAAQGLPELAGPVPKRGVHKH
jgi:hypothetical protein